MAIRTIEQIIVFGSGNWGPALAVLFSKNFPVRVWTIDGAMAEQINANRKKPGFFYKYPIPKSIVIEEKYTGSFDQGKTLYMWTWQKLKV